MGTRALPAGTVTFLFTDVEGSTRLLHSLGSEAYADALAEHHRILREAFAAHGGVEVDTQGDAFFVAFPTAPGALAVATEATEALASGPIKVRIGLHTGTPLLTDEGYVGPDVHKGARIAAAGHGGQVLLSQGTRELVDGEFRDLGEHRLKDFATPVWIHQLGTETFPPLTTIANTNLPSPASTFVGREREVADVSGHLATGTRLVTLTGPGGTGKTRLAIEAARAVIGDFPSGVFWVEAAAYREPELVLQVVSQTLGSTTGLAEEIGERRMLIVIDNLEQVVSVGPELSRLVEACPNLHLLLTSRERLRVRGEREYAVHTLTEAEAVALYSDRATIPADDAATALVNALDRLPLAIELAASRAGILAPTQMLERLSSRLDFLRGDRDADPRQQTLRATIDWSHDLLTDGEQLLFARLSVFSGGGTLDALESVADADLDALQSLVDKSLVRHVDGRFWMLESIGEYAAERLAARPDGEADAIRSRHAAHYLALAERIHAVLATGEPEEGLVMDLEAEIDNLRAAADHGLAVGDIDLVRRLTAALPIYWVVRGRHREGRAWLERAIALDPDARDDTARRLQGALAISAYALGDHPTAVRAADDAAALASELSGAAERITLLRDKAVAAMMRGDNEAAEALFAERLPLALAGGNGVAASSCRINMAVIANRTGRHDRARALLEENLPFVRARAQSRCEATTLSGLAETAVRAGRPDDAPDTALAAARLASEIRDPSLALLALEAVAASAAGHGHAGAATLLAGTEGMRRRLDLEPDPDEAEIRAAALAQIGPDPAADPVYAGAWAAGAALDLPALLDLASALAADLRSAAVT